MVVTQITADSTSRFVQTERWRIHYNEAGSGHPVIMLHGTGPGATGWSNFHQNLIPLSEKYRVIAVDFPGWGQSDPVEPSQRDNALAVKLLMDELGLEKATLVGNSMGAMATLAFAVQYPERMSHIVTMGAYLPGVGLFAPAGFSEGMKVVREAYERPTPENFERLVRVMVYDASFVTKELMEQRASAALANRTHLENWLKPAQESARFGPPDLVQRLTTTTLPALIVHGRDDRTCAMEHSMRVAALLPNATLVVFNRCGHWAQVEHAQQFNWLVDNFIAHNP
jgi:2-hydroxy-6-oxonona-2,4-dienedioate hydrolase